MREIEFRGIYYGPDDIRLWKYGGLYQEGSSCYIIQGFQAHPQETEWVRVDPITVGQFTGLYDKNGKKIYEGDIVKLIYHYREGCKERLFVVKLEELSDEYDFFQDSINNYVRNGYKAEEMEIVGNIYGIPE